MIRHHKPDLLPGRRGAPAASQREVEIMRKGDPGSDSPLQKSIRPDEVDWKPFAAFPPAARLGVLLGHPTQAGFYVIREKLPHGIKMMPHRHFEDRIYTVISGTFYIGVGGQFDPEALVAYPPGSVILLPGGTSHFHWARSGEYITQVMGVGPLGIDYLDADDDPRGMP